MSDSLPAGSADDHTIA